ncbi:MAG: ferredoxin [Flavobacteriales bacterium]|jgi:ferredoxin
MPFINFQGHIISCEKGASLKKVLLENKLKIYNGNAAFLNCRGLGTCGTCCVHVEGKLSLMTNVEKWRLSFPPHKGEKGKRLACQSKVLGDLEVKKGGGFWGEVVKL